MRASTFSIGIPGATSAPWRLATYRKMCVAFGLLLLSFGPAAPPALADQTFHTERIPLSSVAGAPLRSGSVVDIHANGPQIFALERYVLVGGAPNTAYQVNEIVFPLSTGCTGPSVVSSVTRLQTNLAGNGEAGNVITPAQVPPSAHNTVNGIIWQVADVPTGVIDYKTGCVVVAVD